MDADQQGVSLCVHCHMGTGQAALESDDQRFRASGNSRSDCGLPPMILPNECVSLHGRLCDSFFDDFIVESSFLIRAGYERLVEFLPRRSSAEKIEQIFITRTQ